MPNKGWLFNLLLLLSCAASPVYSDDTKLHIIANQSVEVDSLDQDQIRRIFTMYQTNWPNSQPIVVFVLANQHASHQLFSREALGLFPYQLERIWNKLIYSGLGEGPIRLQNETEMLTKVQQQPGAIGYLITKDLPAYIHTIQLAKEQ
jgi:ABC-type phosphate transport system substrate-binding protein